MRKIIVITSVIILTLIAGYVLGAKPWYNQSDLNHDGKVNYLDLSIFSRNYPN